MTCLTRKQVEHYRDTFKPSTPSDLAFVTALCTGALAMRALLGVAVIDHPAWCATWHGPDRCSCGVDEALASYLAGEAK